MPILKSYDFVVNTTQGNQTKDDIVRGLLVDNLPPPRDFMRQFFFLLGYHMVPLDKKVCTKKLQVKELSPLKGY